MPNSISTEITRALSPNPNNNPVTILSLLLLSRQPSACVVPSMAIGMVRATPKSGDNTECVEIKHNPRIPPHIIARHLLQK
jgi:hypothetical protein